ncbi:demethylmenaquinone methyltransferase-like [Lytechinus pictus]|uniref:demethylmenaquinone methyltransferase-like n=1 Tax=Lytechinus pictus TaxID=7653 RepID=UPI0030BA29BA
MPLFTDSIARNLKKPETGFVGSFILRLLKRRNRFLEEKAVEHAEIQPNHHVLEVGFGPGLGLKKAAQCVKKDEGMVHGIDISPAMMNAAMAHLEQEIADDMVQLTIGNAAQLPYRDTSMDRIFHTNCYYFWPDVTAVSRELFRVLKPGGQMVTLLCLERVKESHDNGFLKYGNYDPDGYMDALKTVGFECEGMKSLKDGDEAYEYIPAKKP